MGEDGDEACFEFFTCTEALSLCPIAENETLNIVIVDELLGTLSLLRERLAD